MYDIQSLQYKPKPISSQITNTNSMLLYARLQTILQIGLHILTSYKIEKIFKSFILYCLIFDAVLHLTKLPQTLRFYMHVCKIVLQSKNEKKNYKFTRNIILLHYVPLLLYSLHLEYTGLTSVTHFKETVNLRKFSKMTLVVKLIMYNFLHLFTF